MPKFMVIALVVGVGMLVLVGGIAISGCGAYNNCVAYETSIKAQYEQDKNNYDNYYKKIAEAAQVPAMYADDMKRIYDGVMEGRYGADGSKAMMQWIQEQNPQLDPGMYRQIQQMIEAGRNAFEAEQKSLISKKQEYEKYYSSIPSNLWAKLFGFPKIDMEKYGIVTSTATDKAFEDKKSDPLQVNPKNEKK